MQSSCSFSLPSELRFNLLETSAESEEGNGANPEEQVTGRMHKHFQELCTGLTQWCPKGHFRKQVELV